ncbi:MAG: BamA/TamA family outer membrane protein [Planctomycetota bacterium]
MNNKHVKLAYICLLTLVSIGFAGCSTALFKPVQPWNSDAAFERYANPQLSSGGSDQRPEVNNEATSTSRSSDTSSFSVSYKGQVDSTDVDATKRDAMNWPAQNSLPQRGESPLIKQAEENNNLQFGKQKTLFRGQSPQDTVLIPTDGNDNSQTRQATAQFPELNGNLQGSAEPDSPFLFPSANVGSPNELNPIVPPNAPSGSATFPQNYNDYYNYADLDVYVSETETGRINFGGAYNSDSGIVGQFTIDERNFDITRLPRSFRDIVDGTAWRGGGQNFRLELVPGSDVERYLVSFSEPFLFQSRISFSSSLYLFQRQYFDYDEERLGGRFAFGYRLAPDLSVSAGIRLENVEISDPRVNTSAQLNGVLGDSDLYIGNVSLIRDTRDHPFLPSEGSFTSLTFSQGFGEFDYSRGDIDFRTYKLMYARPDQSGRHTLSYGTKLGFSGSQTPVFENYFAGGFSTLRGFDFRGASPLEGDVRVGGEFQWLNTIEYMFPLTADDMVKGVLFTDFGTVEEGIELNSENFRVAPGFGFRVHLPAAGIGAPLAFDFAFPVSDAAGDEQQTFSFYLGVSR